MIQDRLDATGVLVCFNGVVGNNTRRKLAPNEFQGFALADEYAPLVFVNSTDFKAAQMFTLALELAHLFIAQSGVSTLRSPSTRPQMIPKKFCDKAAAEFLVPAEELRAFSGLTSERANNPYASCCYHRFKVSSIVAARRALDLKLISTDTVLQLSIERSAKEWDG